MRIQDTKKNYNTAIYIRLSKEDGDREESNSVKNQRIMLCKYVEEQEDLSLFKIYTDDGYSGVNFDRPGFSKMIEDIENGHVDCVVFKDLSRIGRNNVYAGYYLEIFFREKDIRYISVTENIDSLEEQNNILMPILNIINQQYTQDISRKVKTSIKVKQKDGQFIGAFASYGYRKNPIDKNKLEIDDYAADIVRRIYRMYADGTGKIRIANILNEEGILCPSEYKKKCGLNYKNSNKMDRTNYWTYSTVNKMLKNQMYIGDLVQGKTCRRLVKGKANYLPEEDWIIVRDSHPAIIDEILWNRVQKTLQRDTRNINFNSNISIFAGFLRCADCGRAMAKNISSGRTHYVCATYKNYGKGKCTSHRINQAELEKIILHDLNLIILSVKDLKDIVDKQEAKQINKLTIEKRIAEYDTQLLKVLNNKKAAYEDYREELISKSEYIVYKDECDEKIDLLNRKKDALQQKITNKKIETPWIQNLLKKNKIEKLDKQILDEMVDMIYVYQDRTLKIVYNFSADLDILLSLYEETNNKMA